MDERIKLIIKQAKSNLNNANNLNKVFSDIDIYDNMTFDYQGKVMQVKEVNVVLEGAKSSGLIVENKFRVDPDRDAREVEERTKKQQHEKLQKIFRSQEPAKKLDHPYNVLLSHNITTQHLREQEKLKKLNQ